MLKRKKNISTSFFYNYSLFYLEKWDNSEEGLRNALKKKLFRLAKEDPEIIYDNCLNFIEEAISKIKTQGLINDKYYAQRLFEREKNKGSSNRKIETKLFQKGISPEIAKQILKENDQTSDELSRAVIFAKKNKLGIYNRKETDKQKQLAKMGRNGFSFEIANRVINMSQADFEDLTGESEYWSSFSL